MRRSRSGKTFLSRWYRVVAVWLLLVVLPAEARVRRAQWEGADRATRLEVLADALIHFEFAEAGERAQWPIPTTDMVLKEDFRGPSRFREGDRWAATARLRVTRDSEQCLAFFDLAVKRNLTRICPRFEKQSLAGLTVSREGTRHVYGLGEQFRTPDEPHGDWMGDTRKPGTEFGNQMVGFNGGAVGNAQFPILYALGEGENAYALFLDHHYAIEWDFTGEPWQIRTRGKRIRGYLIAGNHLKELRARYLALTGRPPVPPRKAFGLWVSEYGFENWGELEGKLAELRKHNFPVDGFVLDLQWFGGVREKSDNSPMGKLTWDLENFPDPRNKIRELNAQGIDLIHIEESYVSRGLKEHETLAEKGFLASEGRGGTPTYITHNPWWGKGGLIDWTNPEAGDYWHDEKRQALVEDGFIGHWTDLGEPEMFNAHAWYFGFPERGMHKHEDIHNLYNLKWHESIARGYERHGVQRRLFLLSRSGTSGIQRFGAAMWSGDIGSNLDSFAAHLNAHMHISLSGIDYFGSDIGGFIRWSLKGDEDEMYTQWFASSAMTDVPVRPHTMNLENKYETSPVGIGDLESNRFNIQTRYRLSPYLYSLAHRAYRYGELVVAPPVYHYPSDENLRENGDQKFLGPDLMTALVYRHGMKARDVYLPRGVWWDWHRNQWQVSLGQTLSDVSVELGGKTVAPLYARGGAVLPLMYVDGKTRNILGDRTDGSRRDELIVRAIAAPDTRGEFTLVEDDGRTVAYRKGAVRETPLSHVSRGRTTHVRIGRARGRFAGAKARRDVVVEIISPEREVRWVRYNGQRVRANRVRGVRWVRTDKGLEVHLPRRSAGQNHTVMVMWEN